MFDQKSKNYRYLINVKLNECEYQKVYDNDGSMLRQMFEPNTS